MVSVVGIARVVWVCEGFDICVVWVYTLVIGQDIN